MGTLAISRSCAAGLDRVQRHMISVLMQTKPRVHESFSDYTKRRHTYCGKLASKHGRWSQLWAQSLCKWSDHVARKHDAGCWSPALLQWHNEAWVTTQRIWASRGSESRTRTRAQRGKVHRRWSDSISRAVQVPDPPCRQST